MRKTLITMGIIAAAGISGYSHVASAADGDGAGTITFTGNIVATTCAVDINGQGANPTIQMGNVPLTALNKKGSTAGIHKIQMNLTECDMKTLTKAAARFGGAYDEVDSDLLALTKSDATAKNIGIEFLYNDGTPMKFGETPSTDKFVEVTDKKATLLYSARYKATADGATAGDANAIAQYTIIYQ